MVRSVQLKKLPTGLEFPADLQAKISYDEAKRELAFRGFMSKVEFDRLLRLSNELEYQRKLEQLFRICVFNESAAEPGKSYRTALVAGAAALVAVAGLAFLLLNYRH
jgi:hypothetical protein